MKPAWQADVKFWNIHDWAKAQPLVCRRCGKPEEKHTLTSGFFTRKVWLRCPRSSPKEWWIPESTWLAERLVAITAMMAGTKYLVSQNKSHD